MSAPVAPAPDLLARLDALCDPAVRDLAWLLFSPPLLRPDPVAPLADPWESPEEADAIAAWLIALDRDASPLHRALSASRLTRLGRYAEELLGWFLLQSPFATLIAANVALRGGGRTLGECDFLVETTGGRRLHWELAVKCYLHAGNGQNGRALLSDFVGPNLRDRFDRKRSHLLDHQLRLSAREEFAALGHPGPWLAQMFVKGWLFYRATGEAAVDPAELAPGHPRGWWVTHGEWPAFADAHPAARWSVLPRLGWLAPRRVAGEPASPDRFVAPAALPHTEIVSPTEPNTLIERVTRRSEPVMIAAFTPDDDGGYRERSRGFIVPDDWPARAQAFAQE